MSVFVVAEIGSVHDGSLGTAKRLADVAAKCGADAAKFQMHIAEAEMLPNAPNPPYFDGEPRGEYFKRTAFSPREWRALKAYCEEKKIEFLCSPFSLEAVHLLEEIGVARYKIPSGEVTNIPLLEQVARTGKPVLLSSGMSDWSELDAAVAAIRRLNSRLTVFQCTSAYPCPYERVGLNVMLQMKERYGLAVGLSDHTLTNYASFAAVTLGAAAIEKHVTLSRGMYGSDARHSLEPREFADLVKGIRAIEAMLSSPIDKADLAPFKEMKVVFEKSCATRVPIPAGATITEEMLVFKKPGSGIPAAKLAELVGKKTAREIPRDTLIQWSDITHA